MQARSPDEKGGGFDALTAIPHARLKGDLDIHHRHCY
jgi:hypothetical protein